MKRLLYLSALIVICLTQCKNPIEKKEIVEPTVIPFTWDNAIVYFLLTDRFNNGNIDNDFKAPADASAAPYRGFMGGDIEGVTQKINDGYFTDLGINAIWTTPLLENIQGSVDEGTGRSYGFHGYWTRDWTAFDERVANQSNFAEFVKSAHSKGIRVIMDVIANHTGPITPLDSKWPDSWVRIGPKCEYKDYKSTVTCTLVDNLPDIKTGTEEEVQLPDFLVKKWKKEGRYEKEVEELDDFFARTKYPRKPYYYIIKWLVDYVKEYGIDGFRVDTAKHTESKVWVDLLKEAQYALDIWKKEHPEEVLDDTDFYMVGEVYNYYISGGRDYDYGDQKVDFFSNGFDALINFDFKSDANKDYESIFTKYDTLLSNQMKGATVLNYISSHDDGGPFDLNREKTYESATKLMLTQGGVQIYYGDELARSLTVEAQGDATLRSFMNWEDMQDQDKKDLLAHWQKLGKFRNDHPAISAGRHKALSNSPYTFSRIYSEYDISDKVVVALDLKDKELIKIPVGGVFRNGDKLLDRYSGKATIVTEGTAAVTPTGGIALLEQIK